ncbi:hypothetical protein EON80_05215 [bacterium]|nr:MAG: hypothetical protein EON80_05215 [bacterium]
MKDVLQAYATLSDPSKRTVYDRDERIREIERIQEKSEVRVYHHPAQTITPRETCGPQSLIGRVRAALGDDQDTFSKKLGLSEAVLCEYEKRDAVPQSPIQFRTFTNLVDIAARKLEGQGQSTEAQELKTLLTRQKARAHFR